MNSRRLGILREILSAASVPFHEEAVAEAVARWGRRRGVRVWRDEAGNVLIRPRRRVAGTGAWVFAAHMDHPGFVAAGQNGRRLRADFLGSVRKEFFSGSRVRFFSTPRYARGAIRTVRRPKGSTWPRCLVELDEALDVPAGTVGCWDLPAWRTRGTRLASRACDDLAGTAAVVCAIDEIAAREIPANVLGLLTRAEEVGGMGAIAACRSGTIPSGAKVVGIETSQTQPGAPLGCGVVIRVGDKMRTFDPGLTAAVTAMAEALKRRSRNFSFVRRLMPGGTCESTIYSLWGYCATALCLPLGNYHNMGPGGRIAPERIDLGDFDCTVRLLVALGGSRATGARADSVIKARFQKLMRKRGKFL